MDIRRTSNGRIEGHKFIEGNDNIISLMTTISRRCVQGDVLSMENGIEGYIEIKALNGPTIIGAITTTQGEDTKLGKYGFYKKL